MPATVSELFFTINNMQEKCLECKKLLVDTDLKIICFECRKHYSHKTKEFMSLGMIEEARKLISSAPLDEKWKRSMLEHSYPEFVQFKWREENVKRIQKEKEVKKAEKDREEIEAVFKMIEEEKEREKKRQEAIVKHRNCLDSLGIPYSGISPPNMKKEGLHRASHCWQCCEQSLDNLIDAECNVCGWIICFCGGCGCGWKRKMTDKTGLESILR